MRRILLFSLPLALAFFSLSLFGQPAAETNKFKIKNQTFTLPPGFEIELVAGPPLIDRPIAAAFDENGFLYVTESSGTNDRVQMQLENKPHRIVRLQDTDGDGKFDKRLVFADKLMFPEGIMCYSGSVYVAAPPQIWKFTDSNGDGQSDQREVWFDGKTLTGCANDLHGPYPGPDGMIYWCKGAFAEQTYKLHGDKKLVTKAAHIFRAKPDASNIEPVMTGGMDNPVDVVFTPGGERIFTTTFLQYPGGGKRDGLLHAVHGGVYGKRFYVIDSHIWTGPDVMPVLSHLGPAAPCGLCRYESDVFGKDYQDNIFATLFNLQKVTRHVLTEDGATFSSQDSDFVVSDSKDFHPTDVIEDADGSLLIVNTGGWYKLCCPTSQLYKPDILGGIYRVRKSNAPKIADPRGLKLPWKTMYASELAALLNDLRRPVRERAMENLAKHGGKAIPALTKLLQYSPSVRARINAVWTATRIDDPSARALVRQALNDADANVRQVALHSVSLWRDAKAVPILIGLLQSSSTHNRRTASEALGRIGNSSAVPALLSASAHPVDRFLDHSITYALIEIGDAKQTAKGLNSSDADVRRVALTALEQMSQGKLSAKNVIQELNAQDNALKESAWWIASRHPEWGKELAAYFHMRFTTTRLTAGERQELAGILAKLSSSQAVQDFLVKMLLAKRASLNAEKHLVLETMAQANLKQTPQSWIDAVIKVLGTTDTKLSDAAVMMIGKLRLPKKGCEKLYAALQQIGNDADRSATTRLAALAVQPDKSVKLSDKSFQFAVKYVGSDQPVSVRSLAAEVLASARLNPKQLVALTEALKTAGPMEADRLLEAYAGSKQDQVGEALIVAIKSSPVKTALRNDKLKTALAKFGPEVQKQADDLYESLKINTADQKAKLDQLLPMVKQGDIQRGQIVFNSTKAACVSCHSIGYLGGKIGPDLTRIGRIRSELDLLEAILFPNASFVRSYEPVIVATIDGKVHNGVILKDSADEVVLTVAADKELHIPRAEIEEILPSSTSIMPAGLDKQLTMQQLADLVTFLKACK